MVTNILAGVGWFYPLKGLKFVSFRLSTRWEVRSLAPQWPFFLDIVQKLWGFFALWLQVHQIIIQILIFVISEPRTRRQDKRTKFGNNNWSRLPRYTNKFISSCIPASQQRGSRRVALGVFHLTLQSFPDLFELLRILISIELHLSRLILWK